MSSSSSSSSGGVGVLGLLGVLFVGLKLTGFVSWSWWWVTAPLWGEFALSLLVCLGALTLAFVIQSCVAMWVFLRGK